MDYKKIFFPMTFFILIAAIAGCGVSSLLNPEDDPDEVLAPIPANSFVVQLGDTTSAPGGDNSGADFCNGVAVDSDGNIYCAGHTDGALGEGNGGSSDAFVMKLNSDGEIVWLTQLGDTTSAVGGDNSGFELCYGVAVDSSGNVYCAGQTNGALGEGFGGAGADAFVMKLNSSGDLVWLTHLGDTTTAPGGSNSGEDICQAVTVDDSGNVYCAGRTEGGMGETNGGNKDAFVLKLDSSGAIVWLTQLGDTTGPGDNTQYDDCLSVSVDSSGNVYCAGGTRGGLGEGHAGSLDAFVMKLNSDGEIVWLTQLGSATKAFPGADHSGLENCTGVAVDGSGNVYCAGTTDGALGETNVSTERDMFVLKLNSSGAIVWLTQLGDTTSVVGGDNAGTDECAGVAVDDSGNVYCAGRTDGGLGETNGGLRDLFVIKLDSSGAITWLTQLGDTTSAVGGDNSGFDVCNGVAVDRSGNVYCAAGTNGALGEAHGGGSSDAFVMKLNSSGGL